MTLSKPPTATRSLALPSPSGRLIRATQGARACGRRASKTTRSAASRTRRPAAFSLGGAGAGRSTRLQQTKYRPSSGDAGTPAPGGASARDVSTSAAARRSCERRLFTPAAVNRRQHQRMRGRDRGARPSAPRRLPLRAAPGEVVLMASPTAIRVARPPLLVVRGSDIRGGGGEGGGVTQRGSGRC